MSKDYKNILKLRNRSWGKQRRENLTKEVLYESTPLPKPVSYEDIDREFRKWVDETLSIEINGERVPTFNLFSNQRFSEYMQTWQHVDGKRNVILNFKTISRENNPRSGTINNQTKNIPGDRTYLMERVNARDANNREYYIDYCMKQPFSVDLIYKLGFVTDKFEMLNKFNEKVNERFKSIYDYIRPNGHFMSMTLDQISDDSSYSIDDRQFFSQTYTIKVRAYIIREEDLLVKETPKMLFTGFEGDEETRSFAEIEEIPCPEPYNPYYYKPISINVILHECDTKIKFTIDCYCNVVRVETENVRNFKLYCNDNLVEEVEGYHFKPNDILKITAVRRFKTTENAVIHLIGEDTTTVYNIENDNPEIAENDKQPQEEIIVED